LLISQLDRCHVIVFVIWSKHNKISDNALVSFSVFRYNSCFFQNCNILLYLLQIRCILNVLMHVVNHLYRWWIGVGRWHFFQEPCSWRYDWQNVCGGMTQFLVLLVKYFLSQSTVTARPPYKCSFFDKILWSIVSNALERSRNIAIMVILLWSEVI